MKIYLFALVSLLGSMAFSATYPVVKLETPFAGSRLWAPQQSGKKPSIVLLHGSEGGSATKLDVEANVLATQGYSVLLYCYFDCGRGLTGPRGTLQDVEATRILDAVEWLRSRPDSNGKVAVYGFSRGAELTMLVGSLPMSAKNRPDALVAHTPSDVINGAYNWDWQEYSCWLCKAGLGKCNSDSPKSDYQWNPACGGVDPNKMDHKVGAWLINGAKTTSGQRIQIEKYDGPILLTVGEKDELWPVDQTRRIEATLKAAHRSLEIHYFPNGGHGLAGQDEMDRKNFVLNFLEKLK